MWGASALKNVNHGPDNVAFSFLYFMFLNHFKPDKSVFNSELIEYFDSESMSESMGLKECQFLISLYK